jgi:membrane protein
MSGAAGTRHGLRHTLLYVARHPLHFTWTVLKAFRANQGLLLAGAVAYYALLSIVPMLILAVIALTHVIDPANVLGVLTRYLEWLLPGQAAALVGELGKFIAYRDTVGWVLLATMLFFSSLAFGMLENAMSVIFHHRVVERKRPFIVSALLPYGYVLSLGLGMLVVTVVAGALQSVGSDVLSLFGREWSLGRVSRGLLYLLGFAGEVAILASIYMVMPVGRLSWRHALFGALIAAALWEVSRHVLLWYFDTLSQISTVYGSFTTAIAVLLSLEVAGTLLLLGAQVIAELERLGRTGNPDPVPVPLRTPA